MSITSKLPDVIDYLVTTFTAASTLGAAADPVAVHDGPVTTQAPARRVLWVGLDDPGSAVDQDGGGAVDDTTAGTSEQTWTGPGYRWRDETVTVNCCAEAWSGVTDVRTVRQDVVAIAAAVQDLIHADATLGGLTSPGKANVTGGELRQGQGPRGVVCRWTFQIVVDQLRIGGAP